MEWQPIETAPKDGTFIVAMVGKVSNPHWAHLEGRAFVIRHEGVKYDMDLGWAMFPGFGGAPDKWFTHWMPLPAPPQ